MRCLEDIENICKCGDKEIIKKILYDSDWFFRERDTTIYTCPVYEIQEDMEDEARFVREMIELFISSGIYPPKNIIERLNRYERAQDEEWSERSYSEGLSPVQEEDYRDRIFATQDYISYLRRLLKDKDWR